MSEEMINLESYDTLGIKMENPIQQKLQQLPHPPFFMDPKKALPFWLVRPLEDKMPMVSIPEKIKVPYTRGIVGENLIQSVDPNQFVPLDPTEGRVEYSPFHDKNLKKFFKSPNIRKMVEKTGDLINGRTACTLKEYNDYRRFVHKMLLNHVTQEQREEEKVKAQELDLDNFLRAAKKEGKLKWNRRFKEYLKEKNQMALDHSKECKLKKCAERMQRGEKARERVRQMREKTQELRNAKWVAYKKRMDNYFKAIKDDQRRRGIYARKRWMVEAVINQHRKSFNAAENKFKRETVMETNWNRRMAGQKLKLKKDNVVREQYHACIQLMKSRREKYYNSRDVEVDELLALPGMNSLDELEVFNTQFDQFTPEFVQALHGAKFYINRSAKSLTLDKSLRKYIVHHESATERMKKANVARPIKHALDLLIRRSVGYYAMVVMYKTIKEATPLALRLADKIQSSQKLRELLLEEYRQFGPRSDTPFQTAKQFQEDGLSHCMCDYTLVDKDTLTWPCPLCRVNQRDSYESAESSESTTCSSPEREEEVFVLGDGMTTVGFLIPPKITEGMPEVIFTDTAVEVEPLVVEGKLKPKTLASTMVSPPKEEISKEPDFTAEPKAEKPPPTTKVSKLFRKSIKKRASRARKSSKMSQKSKKSTGSKASKKYQKHSQKQKDAKPGSSKTNAQNESRTTGSHPKSSLSEHRKKSRSTKKTSGENTKHAKKSNLPKKSILKRKNAAPPKGPKKKGVSFVEQAELQQAAQQSGDSRFPTIENVSLVKASISQSFLPVVPPPTYVPRSASTTKRAVKKQPSPSIAPEVEDTDSGRSSIVSLLSITSDDRLHFVKGQCVHTKRGSKFGKIAGGMLPSKQLAGVKKGFIRGTCKCFVENEVVSESSHASNITERLERSAGKRRKVTKYTRWRGVPVADGVERGADEQETDLIIPSDLATLLSQLSPKKQAKIRYLLGAPDLVVVCQCPKCQQKESAKTTAVIKDGELLTKPTETTAAATVCRCQMQHNLTTVSAKNDRLAYITKVIGKTDKIFRGSTVSETKSTKSRKISARSMMERHKSIISRYWKKKSVNEVRAQPILRREPEVQKYYVDDIGNLYVLNRYGKRTVLKNIAEEFKIDEKGRKYFVDEYTGKRYLTDVTGRVYLENDNGDILSLFYEDGKEYQDPEPKKLQLHDKVRESVVDLLNEVPQESLFDNEDDLVEMVYEYLFEGSDDKSESFDKVSDVRSEESEKNEMGETQSNTRGIGVTSSKALAVSKAIGPRMPIKRPLNSLIREVPCNREISKLFIQRKKFHDCAAIVFRRTLLYSLASFTKIIDRGSEPASGIETRKKITGLDGMVKGLTKITAHYPLKLIKSKRLAPYVDAVVQGFLGTESNQIFPGRAPIFPAPSTTDDVSVVGSDWGNGTKKSKKMHITEVEDLDKLKHICFCGKEDAAVLAEKNATSSISELMKASVCKKQG